ncbi:MAG: phage holin family protein [Bacteroidales bacterium]|nr:phage holin family protein [Bacteroidales bacterium]
MENKEYQRLINDAKQYVQMRYDLLKLELLDKLSRIIAYLLVVIITLVLGLTAFVYFSLALAYALKPLFGGMGLPLVIIGLFFVLILVVLFRRKEKIFLNPIITKLSSILFEEQKLDDEPKETTKTTTPTETNAEVEESI